MLDGAAGHKHKHRNITTLRSSSAYAYTYVAVMTSGWYTGKHKISISEKLSTNQRALYSYADHVLTGHKLSRSRRPMLMLESQLPTLGHKLLIFILMLMLASQMRVGL